MELDSCSVGVATHRWIPLDNLQINSLDAWVTTEQPVTDPSRNPFQKVTWNSHLLGNQLIDIGIIERVVDIVTRQGLADIILDAKIQDIVIPRQTFLGQDAMISMET